MSIAEAPVYTHVITLPSGALKACQRRLNKLDAVFLTLDLGDSGENLGHSRLEVTTAWSVGKLHQWCCRTRGIDHVDVLNTGVDHG